VNITLFIILAVLNLPFFWLLAKSFFRDWEGFRDAVVAMIVHSIVSAATGKNNDHRIGGFTLMLYVIVCLSTLAAEYHAAGEFILGMENPWGY
jgi:hypothetical protein